MRIIGFNLTKISISRKQELKGGHMLTEWINANYATFLVSLFVIAIWELFWKLTAMWKASKRNSKGWFVVLMIFNTLGILPIIYHLCTRKKVQKPVNQT